MRIERIRTLAGPNVWASRPLLAMDLDLGELAELCSDDAEGFTDGLMAVLPGLVDHHCSPGRPFGFLERMRKGTYLGHITEHVALELAALAGLEVTFGKTRGLGSPGRYVVLVEFAGAEAAMRQALETAVDLVDAALHGRPFPVEGRVARLREAVARTRLGPSTQAIVDAAAERGIPWVRLNDASLLQLGYGAKRRLVQASLAGTTAAVAVEMVSDKQLTKDLLRQAEIPVPEGFVVTGAAEAVAMMPTLRPPLVVKPLDASKGRGVSLGLSTADEVSGAVDEALRHGDRVIVEEQVAGSAFRVLVVGGRMVAASRREPARVRGDGRHTIAELVALANADPRRGEDHELPLTRIRLDDGYLARQRLHPVAIPAEGFTVQLRPEANLSTGGTATDVTDLVHPWIAAACERAARVVGLDVCGVDVIAADIAAPPRPGRFAILELNAAPGLRMHEHPSGGQARRAGKAIVDLMFPPGDDGRIPIVSVTGTNGKTTVTRMIGHMLTGAGQTVGMTTTEGIYLGGRQVASGDCAGPNSARALLRDPEVGAAVLETARGGILRDGLAYDWSDVAVITNVDFEHIGQDGVEDLDDLVRIKSVVAERVRDGGTLVLNADNPHAAAMGAREPVLRRDCRVVYFTLDPRHDLVARHRDGGGVAYVLRDDLLVEAVGHDEIGIVAVPEIPVAMRGAAPFQIANALAAVAACRALGVPAEACAAALRTFTTAQNPGRLQHYRTPAGDLLVDYGHNPGAYTAIAELATRWRASRTTAIIDLPGDRADSVITAAAAAVAGRFDRLFIRESADLRGRAPGEVAGLMRAAVHRIDPAQHCDVMLDERQALHEALMSQQPGELLIACYDDQSVVDDVLRHHDVTPA